jgi:hypothetical protein
MEDIHNNIAIHLHILAFITWLIIWLFTKNIGTIKISSIYRSLIHAVVNTSVVGYLWRYQNAFEIQSNGSVTATIPLYFISCVLWWYLMMDTIIVYYNTKQKHRKAYLFHHILGDTGVALFFIIGFHLTALKPVFWYEASNLFLNTKELILFYDKSLWHYDVPYFIIYAGLRTIAYYYSVESLYIEYTAGAPLWSCIIFFLIWLGLFLFSIGAKYILVYKYFYVDKKQKDNQDKKLTN